MTRVLYLGPDITDYAVERRVRSFQHVGASVLSFTFRRSRYSNGFEADWPNVDLGRARDGSYLGRLGSLAGATRQLWLRRDGFASATLIYARNLDLALLGLVGILFGRRRTPFVYEVLDIRPIMLQPSVRGALARLAERIVLRASSSLVVSSEAFVSEYFEPVQRFRGKWKLMENRVMPTAGLAARPTGPSSAARPQNEASAVRIGWFGTLRCERSLELLAGLAHARPRSIELVLAGHPSRVGLERFSSVIDGLQNVSYLGPYRTPDDLADLYKQVDLCWSIDLSDAGSNSDWLLPNRLYEAGYFCVPSITLEGQYSDTVAQARGWSISLAAPTIGELCALIERSTNELEERQRALCSTDIDSFRDTGSTVRRLIEVDRERH